MGLYNLNFEYHVFNLWIEKLTNVLAPVHHTQSAARTTLATAEAITASVPPPAHFTMSLSDCTVALNPLGLPSRGILLITSTAIQGQWDFQQGGCGKFDVDINRVHLFCIDDAANLITPSRPGAQYAGRRELLGSFSVMSSSWCTHE